MKTRATHRIGLRSRELHGPVTEYYSLRIERRYYDTGIVLALFDIFEKLTEKGVPRILKWVSSRL
jgi:hypothetical protein